MQQYGQQPQFPFVYPGVYSPGQMAGTNNAEFSNLMTMFAGPILGAMAGPGNFLPHMMPTQSLMDQFALRNYQDQKRTATFNLAHDNTPALATRFLGARSAITNDAPSELNREQAANIAGMVNNPIVKSILGTVVGPENLEAALHGSKGDVNALGAAVGRIGYFRQPSTGRGRMNAEQLEDYTRGVYSHLYEPQGDIEDMTRQARADDAGVRQEGRDRLKKAAKAEHAKIVEDTDVEQRLQKMDNAPTRIDELYKKYVNGGKATDTAEQAKELVKFDRAIKAADVLKENETTIGGLEQQAKKIPSQEMHGFMAGQAGQITEHMFQRGMLPQSLGTMSAADRARMINSAPIDEETMTRLTREHARRDLSAETNSSDAARQYRGLTSDTERERYLDTAAGKNSEYRKTLETTRKEVEKTASGDKGAMSATDLEKLNGFDALASNVDSKRSSEAVKKYSAAVAAVRDIFGDNGNPNAPLPALLTALEGLTGGAVGSMKPQKIEAALRQMQTVAKEAGIGFEQMAAISTQIDAQGQAMGLQHDERMQLKQSAMAGIKTMSDTGAFSNPVHGQLDRDTAGARLAEVMAGGAASRNSRSMAALESIYQSDPKAFKGTELEAALEAYRDNNGDGTYTDPATGKKKNIRETIGKYGPRAAQEILLKSGGTQTEYAAQINNPDLEIKNTEFGFLTQKHSQTQQINNSVTRPLMSSAMRKAGVEVDKQTQYELGDVAATMIIDTADMGIEKQREYINEHLEEKFTEVFAKSMPADQAAKKAKEAADAVKANRGVNTLIGAANTRYGGPTGRRPGETLSANAQRRGGNRDQQIVQDVEASRRQATRRAEAGLGFEGTPTGRVSDYLYEIGERGENFTAAGFLEAMAPVVSDRELLSRYTKDMEGGFSALTDMRKDALITNKKIDTLTSNNDIAGLKKIAGVGDKVSVITDEEAEKLGGELGADKITKSRLITQARQQVGTAERGRERDVADFNKIEKSFLAGRDTDVLREGVAATFRVHGLKLKDEQEKAIFDAVSDTSPEGKKRLDDELKKVSASKETKGRLTEMLKAQQAGIPLDAGRMLSLEKIPDRDLQRETTPTEKEILTAAEQSLAPEQNREKVYDYKKLGVPETATAQQKEIMARLAKDPSGELFAKEMQTFDPTVRNAMFALPDKDAVDLFNKFDPEAKAKGLKQLEGAKSNSWLTEDQRQNASRLHDAITSAENQQQNPATAQSESKVADTAQNVNTLEVSAQTVTIDGEKVNGSDDSGAKAVAALRQAVKEVRGERADAVVLPARMPTEKTELKKDAPLKDTLLRDKPIAATSLPRGALAAKGVPQVSSVGGSNNERAGHDAQQAELSAAIAGAKFSATEVPLGSSLSQHMGAGLKRVNEETFKKAAGISSANLTPENSAAAMTAAATSPDLVAHAADVRHDLGSQFSFARRMQEVTASETNEKLTQSKLYTPASPASGGNSEQNMTINGTLTLSGLQEAILSASGNQVVQTESGGAPIVLDPAARK
jgi:hypothetical protein